MTAPSGVSAGDVRFGSVTVSPVDGVDGAVVDAVAEEVLAAFCAYETALVSDDIDTMTGFFWSSEDVVRFGVADAQRGATAVLAWRRASGGVPPGRWLDETDVLVLSADAAVVTTRFGYRQAEAGPGAASGRQTQVWARLPEGWRVVSAHVSDVGLL